MRVDGFLPGGSDRKRFEAALSEPYRLLWLFCVDTGLRIGDALKVKVADVVGFCEGVYVTEQKTKTCRHVKLRPATQKALLGAISSRGGHEYVWASPRIPGRPITRQAAWRVFRKTQERVNVRKHIGTHSARKTFAQNIYRNSTLEDVQEVLKHKYPDTTMFYLLNPKMRRRRDRK